ncbi:ribonuclease P protein component [Zavarzinia sp. CC-PAN008]|uniref:ribonuclease P protein component n=1 Tax=Zavarzinia sp. CC-PAN008 TaxID=3243332 RepID=UPI003F747DD1
MVPDPASAALHADPACRVAEGEDRAVPVAPLAVQRLKRRSQFLAVAATRRSWSTPGLVLQVRGHQPVAARGDTPELLGPQHPGPKHLGLGFTVSRKVGNSVVRNRARRRLREAAREALRAAQAKAAAEPGAAPPLSGFDLVAIGRKDTPHRPFAQLVADFAAALERVTRAKAKGRDTRP